MLSKVAANFNNTYFPNAHRPLTSAGVVDSETIGDMVEKNPKCSPLVKVSAVAGSALATLAFLFAIAKRENGKNFNFKQMFKLDFENPLRAIAMATTSTLGGLAGGLIADKKENRKLKLKEGMHQFLGNIITPIGIVGIATTIVNNRKGLSGIQKKLYSGLAAIVGVVTGVTLGNKVASKVNTMIYKEDDTRKIKAKDFGIHVDDIMTWLALTSKGDLIKSFIGKALPAVYLLCGYEAGTSTGAHHKH